MRCPIPVIAAPGAQDRVPLELGEVEGIRPDPQDIGRFEWQTVLAYLGAGPEEIVDVQKRMGRFWR
jgi:hypothetical protein